MNKKIYFDLDNVTCQTFVKRLFSLKFEKNTHFSVNLFILPSRQEVIRNPIRRFSFVKEGDSLLFLIKVIPFVLYDRDDIMVKIKALFSDVFVSVSYADIGKLRVGKEYYNKAFCIEFTKSRLFR